MLWICWCAFPLFLAFIYIRFISIRYISIILWLIFGIPFYGIPIFGTRWIRIIRPFNVAEIFAFPSGMIAHNPFIEKFQSFGSDRRVSSMPLSARDRFLSLMMCWDIFSYCPVALFFIIAIVLLKNVQKNTDLLVCISGLKMIWRWSEQIDERANLLFYWVFGVSKKVQVPPSAFIK